MLADVPRLVTAYLWASRTRRAGHAWRSGPPGIAAPPHHAFNEAHILAISQALAITATQRHRRAAVHGHRHPRAAEPALASALEVFAANGVEVMIDQHDGYTPTPVISHAILTYNKGRESGLADGVVMYAVA